MRLRAAIAGLALLVLSQPASARPACPVPLADLNRGLRTLPGALAVLTTQRRDPDSGEPVRRTVVETASGTAVVVEQKNCAMWNLSVSVLTPQPAPAAADLRLLGKALGLTPLWRKWFAGRDALDFAERAASSHRAQLAAGQHFAAPVDAPPAEALLAYAAAEPRSAPWTGMLTLTISAGGE